jgi:hypothetical protein
MKKFMRHFVCELLTGTFMFEPQEHSCNCKLIKVELPTIKVARLSLSLGLFSQHLSLEDEVLELVDGGGERFLILNLICFLYCSIIVFLNLDLFVVASITFLIHYRHLL